jgi:putative ABC transport system ATP-binding protein
MALLDDLNKEGTTICMVTHDPRYADHAKIKLNLLDGIILDNIALESALQEAV